MELGSGPGASLGTGRDLKTHLIQTFCSADVKGSLLSKNTRQPASLSPRVSPKGTLGVWEHSYPSLTFDGCRAILLGLNMGGGLGTCWEAPSFLFGVRVEWI